MGRSERIIAFGDRIIWVCWYGGKGWIKYDIWVFDLNNWIDGGVIYEFGNCGRNKLGSGGVIKNFELFILIWFIVLDI